MGHNLFLMLQASVQQLLSVDAGNYSEGPWDGKEGGHEFVNEGERSSSTLYTRQPTECKGRRARVQVQALPGQQGFLAGTEG